MFAALFLSLSAPSAAFRSRSGTRVQIVLVQRLRRLVRVQPRRRARLRWER